MEENIIEVKNLTKDYGSGRGVFDVSISVKKGEVFGFLGPNGAGKSTTIRHLLGFSNPDSGTCKINGFNSFKDYDKVLSNVGYIPGEVALPSGLTGFEFIKMMQDMQNIHNEKQLNKMLDLFELEENILNSETKKMSLGVKRKLAIVVAFMSNPDVLILDEPTSGLDPVMQEKFISFIHEEKRRGKTILLSSHIFSEIDSTCDRIAIIKDGKIVSNFIANDLKHASLKFYTINFNTTGDKNKFKNEINKLNYINFISDNDKEIYLSVDDSKLNQLIDILAKYSIKSFSNKLETLEDFFMKFYKEDRDFKGALK